MAERALFYQMNNCLPMSDHFLNHSGDIDGVNFESGWNSEETSPWLDDDIVDAFGPSRLPPRIIFGYHVPGKVWRKRLTGW